MKIISLAVTFSKIFSDFGGSRKLLLSQPG